MPALSELSASGAPKGEKGYTSDRFPEAYIFAGDKNHYLLELAGLRPGETVPVRQVELPSRRLPIGEALVVGPRLVFPGVGIKEKGRFYDSLSGFLDEGVKFGRFRLPHMPSDVEKYTEQIGVDDRVEEEWKKGVSELWEKFENPVVAAILQLTNPDTANLARFVLEKLGQDFNKAVEVLRSAFSDRWMDRPFTTGGNSRPVDGRSRAISAATATSLLFSPLSQAVFPEAQSIKSIRGSELPPIIAGLPDWMGDSPWESQIPYAGARYSVSSGKIRVGSTPMTPRVLDPDESLRQVTTLAVVYAYQKLDRKTPAGHLIPDTKDPKVIEAAAKVVGMTGRPEGISDAVVHSIITHPGEDPLKLTLLGFQGVFLGPDGKYYEVFKGGEVKELTPKDVKQKLTLTAVWDELLAKYRRGSCDEPAPPGVPAERVQSDEERFSKVVENAIASSPYREAILEGTDASKEGEIPSQLVVGVTYLKDEGGVLQPVVLLMKIDSTGQLIPFRIDPNNPDMKTPFFFFTESDDFVFKPPGEGDPSDPVRLLPVVTWIDENGMINFGFVHKDGSGKFQPAFTLIRVNPNDGTATYHDPYSGELFVIRKGQSPFYDALLSKISYPGGESSKNPSSVTPTPEEGKPKDTGNKFANQELAESYGYSVAELMDKGFVGVEKGKKDFGGVEYNCLIGTTKDGEKKVIGFIFEEAFVPLDEDQVLELSQKIKEVCSGPYHLNFGESYSVFSYGKTFMTDVCAVSTGIPLERVFENGDREIGFVAVVNSFEGDPRLMLVSVQSFRADSPDKPVIDGMWWDLPPDERGRGIVPDDIVKYAPFGRIWFLGLWQGNPINSNLPAWQFRREHYISNDEFMRHYMEFLNSKGKDLPGDKLIIPVVLGIGR